MIRIDRWALACVGLLVVASLAAAENWPRFRGPNGTGLAADKDIPVKWDDKSILWQVEVPGAGHSSPIVWEKKLFLQSAGKDGKDRWLLCYDAESGKELWKETLPGEKASTHKQSSLASSTPATDGKHVYAVSWDGKEMTLYAYTLEGKFVWKQPLGPHTSQHGAGISPIIHDGLVILTNDDDSDANVLAFDARTGKPQWKVGRPKFRACYSTPFILETSGKPELIVASTAGVTSYEPKSGEVNWKYIWKFDRKPLRTVGSPIFANGVIAIGAGDGDGSRHMIAVRAAGKGDVSDTNLAWQDKKSFPYVPSMLAAGDHIYSVNDAGVAHCHQAATGKEVWSRKVTDDVQVSSSPVLIDGKIYVADVTGNVHVFAAAPEYKELAVNDLKEAVRASPAVANNRLYIRGDKHLFCIGKK